jgi:DNA repair exonuclease SbcCD ATPase subunit
MKIINFYSENVKRLRAVDITPSADDNVVILSGGNEAGKSSVLDAIWLALDYSAAKKDNPQPLRAGAQRGKAVIDMGEYIVTRIFRDSGTSALQITTPDQSKIAQPQKLLDGLIGDLSFDPWDFARQSEKEQREILADVIYRATNGQVDLNDFDARHKKLYDERTDLNRTKKRLSATLSGMTVPAPDTPTEEIDISALTQQLETIRQQLEQATTHNRRVEDAKKYREMHAELTQTDKAIDGLNRAIELNKINKEEALEDALAEGPFKIKGLKLTEDGLMIENEEGQLVPFKQGSAARQIRISLGIGMAANPKLRVMYIRDGSLLNDKNMQIVREMAEENDYQVWVEVVSRNENDKMGVYIEDGRVAN